MSDGRPARATVGTGGSHVYVTQRIGRLKLIPEFQALLRDGSINIKIGRKLGTLSDEEQRNRLAAGPPYTEKDGAAVNPVNTGAPLAEPAPSGAAGNPVTTRAPLAEPAPKGAKATSAPAALADGETADSPSAHLPRANADTQARGEGRAREPQAPGTATLEATKANVLVTYDSDRIPPGPREARIDVARVRVPLDRE